MAIPPPIPDRELHDLSMERPHLVVLGAGASRAACPTGDRTGRKLPVMLDLVETLGLGPALDRAGIEHGGRNFEIIYQDIFTGSKDPLLRREVEDTVRQYFASLRLPDSPTVYDHLVLSLRPKDVIATFNWDPLLVEACQRNSHVAKHPHVLFLHGNVAIGTCSGCRVKGKADGRCPSCGAALEPSKLLYPVQEKNYEADPHISGEWETLKRVLANAFVLTIFGYGAPESDVPAIEAMKVGWGRPDDREFEEIEIVDIRKPNELASTWKPFIHTHHYQVHPLLSKSSVGRHPRRSCEAMWRQFMLAEFVSDNPAPATEDWNELWEWYGQLTYAEVMK